MFTNAKFVVFNAHIWWEDWENVCEVIGSMLVCRTFVRSTSQWTSNLLFQELNLYVAIPLYINERVNFKLELYEDVLNIQLGTRH